MSFASISAILHTDEISTWLQIDNTPTSPNVDICTYDRKKEAIIVTHKNYSKFLGKEIPPLIKEFWNKGMALSRKYRNMDAW